MSRIFLFVLLFSTFLSCKKDNDNNTVVNPFEDNRKAVLEGYGEMVYANYQESREKAVLMQTAIDAFLNNPSEGSLSTARKAWIEARPMYLQTEAFRKSNGPIDDATGPEGLMNGWPLDESYIDYVSGNPNAGIINNPGKLRTITKDSLIILNELEGETTISTGYHAIEFLLWGQDLSVNSPGNRSFTDYTILANFERRKAYLKAVTELLIDHHDYLLEAWRPFATNFRSSLIAAPKANLNKILSGLKDLCNEEFAGERMQVAINEQSQEHEHSCFSDNTNNDHKYDLQGIINVYKGVFLKSDGSVVSGSQSISSLLRSKDPDLDGQILVELENARSAVDDLFTMRFDQAILNPLGKSKIETAIVHLNELSLLFNQAFDVLNK